MKKQILNVVSGVTGLFCAALFCGCSAVTPVPLADPNAQAVAEPVWRMDEWYLFAETPDVLRVKVQSRASGAVSAENAAGYIERNIVKYNAAAANGENEPCDAVICLESNFKELTAAPRCRMSHVTAIEILSPKGGTICGRWENKTESQNAFADAKNARQALENSIQEGIDSWLGHTFAAVSQKQLAVHILRFRTSDLVLRMNSFEKDLGEILNLLRKTGGVRDVRVIEADKENRTVSFRVLFEKAKFPDGLAESISQAK